MKRAIAYPCSDPRERVLRIRASRVPWSRALAVLGIGGDYQDILGNNAFDASRGLEVCSAAKIDDAAGLRCDNPGAMRRVALTVCVIAAVEAAAAGSEQDWVLASML